MFTIIEPFCNYYILAIITHVINLQWIGWCSRHCPPCFPEKLKNFGAAAEKAGPGQHIESLGCENCDNVRKIAKKCVFHSRSSKKNFAKTLLKLYEELRLLQYFAKFLPVVGVNAPLRRAVLKLWKIREMWCFSPVFRHTFKFQVKILLQNVLYFANIEVTSRAAKGAAIVQTQQAGG